MIEKYVNVVHAIIMTPIELLHECMTVVSVILLIQTTVRV